jgi:hypothetical protein
MNVIPSISGEEHLSAEFDYPNYNIMVRYCWRNRRKETIMATFDNGYALLIGVGTHQLPAYSLPALSTL